MTPSARIGDFFGSGSWKGYWKSSIAEVGAGELRIRGYQAEDIIANLNYAETLYLTIRGEIPTPQQARVMDAVLCAAPDHGLISVHAAAARFVASAQPDTPISAIVAGALCAGDVTISPQASATNIERGRAMVAAGSSETEAAQAIVDDYLSRRRPVPGLGHPNHKRTDPRAAALRKVAEDEGVWSDGGRFYDHIHECFMATKNKELAMNIDGVFAATMWDLGFTPRQMPGIAVLAIMPGIIAHVDEEMTAGVPMRVIPESEYTGVPPRALKAGHWRTGGQAAASA
jgi:citryl-CoA lyase